MPSPKALPVQPRSLVGYVRDKKKVGCKLCALPKEITEQLRGAGRRKITVPDRLEWLEKEVGVRVTEEEFALHVKGLHDVR